ncbi:MAG: fimbrillin family protein [Bacteroidaceae bacterium]|nr:fimbrillin family protein [Bacteroidaceae bacterium]
MKERILLLIFAVSSILVGCTNDGAFDGSATGTPSDVPILLNAKGLFDVNVSTNQQAPATRASINDASELGEVGIFMLAGKKTGINGSAGTEGAQDIDWSVQVDPGADYATTTNGVYWHNVKCTLDAATELLKNTGESDPIWYYPITSWYAYDFYGYHPYQDDVNPLEQYATGKYRLTVDFDIDGTKDILWGRSDIIEGNNYAYSAKYFRTTGENAAHMTFYHKLAQFRFYLVPAKDNEAEDDSFGGIEGLSLKSVTMHSVATKVQMTLADSDPNNQGNVGNVRAVSAKTADIPLKDKDGNEIAPVPFETTIGTDGSVIGKRVRVGDCIMLCPFDTEYKMSIVLCDAKGNEYHSEKKMSITLANGSPFQPGKIYNININATGVTGIALNATVEPWGEVDDDNLNFDIN